MAHDIVLTVDEGRAADAARFFEAGQHLIALLDALSDSPNVEWEVADLRLGSAVDAIEAAGDQPDDGRRAAASAVRGLRLVQNGAAVPDDWTPEAVSRAQDLVRTVDEHTKIEREGNVVWLDGRLKDALAQQTPWHREMYGCVRGKLTGVNVTRGNRASVKPFSGGRVVRIGFPSSIAEQMRDALLHDVQIDGMMRQDADGRVYHVTAETVHVVDGPVPSWRELFGSIPEITNGLSVNEYLEAVRGED